VVAGAAAFWSTAACLTAPGRTHSDAALGSFFGQCCGKGFQPSLGRSIGGEAGQAQLFAVGADIHQMGFLGQQGQAEVGAGVGAGQVGVQDAFPVGRGKVGNRAGEDVAGCVEPEVDRWQFLCRLATAWCALKASPASAS
jgi:hypothetical protein